MNNIYVDIVKKIDQRKKQLAVLIDPDKYSDQYIDRIMEQMEICPVDFFMIGGSIVAADAGELVKKLKERTNLPVVLYPGSIIQISDQADGIFLLSLISGRNPELLIGNHVIAAPLLKQTQLEIISTGYILVESDHTTAVQYMSNTNPLPYDKPDIAAATAMAGEMLGLKLIYLEAGSGASKMVNQEMISAVRKSISVPLLVGGGITDANHLEQVYKAGADIAVVGTCIEHDVMRLSDLLKVLKKFKT